MPRSCIKVHQNNNCHAEGTLKLRSHCHRSNGWARLVHIRDLARVWIIKLVHGILLGACFQGRVTREELLVTIPHVRASHILMLHTCNTLTDLHSLDFLHITKHGFLAKVITGQAVSGLRSSVVCRQRYQVMENACML